MRAFKTIIWVLALVPILTGLLDWAWSLQAAHLIGAQLSPADYADPLLNSQIRFFGAIWFGVGLLLFACLRNLDRYSAFLRATLAVIFLAGIGRVASVVQFGLPANAPGAFFVVVTTAIEIIGMPLLLWWHSSLNRLAHDAMEA